VTHEPLPACRVESKSFHLITSRATRWKQKELKLPVAGLNLTELMVSIIQPILFKFCIS